MKILGMGNALIDMVAEMPDDSLLRELDLSEGSMQLVDKDFSTKVMRRIQSLPRLEKSGGSAANTICGLSALGMETAFIGKVGRDRLGNVFRKDLESYGVKPLLQYGSTETGLAVALVSPNGERSFATYLGAAIEMEPADLPENIFPDYTHFYIEGYLVQHRELIERAVELAGNAGLSVILDLASFNVVEDNREFLRFLVGKYADIVFANEEEAFAYAGEKNPEKALHAIAQDCRIAIVKRGASGSLIQTGERMFRIDPIRVNCVDTTGAGDLYAAGFLYGLLNGLRLPLCGEIGSILAGKVIEVTGAKISGAVWPEIIEQVRNIAGR
jgi:sugar/nucleoside kinase (ribokinase family)